MNFTTVMLSLLMFLALVNVKVVSDMGRQIHYIKCDVESIHNQNIWMRDRLERKGEK